MQGKEIPDYVAAILVKRFSTVKYPDYKEILVYLSDQVNRDQKQSAPIVITTKNNIKLVLSEHQKLPQPVLNTLWSEGVKSLTDWHFLQAHVAKHQDVDAEAMLADLLEMKKVLTGCDVPYVQYNSAVATTVNTYIDFKVDIKDDKDAKNESIELQYQRAYETLCRSVKTNLLCIKIIAEEGSRWDEFTEQLRDYDSRHFQTRLNQQPALPSRKYRFLDKTMIPYEEHTKKHDEKKRSKVQAHKQRPATHAPKTPATAVVNLASTTFGELDPKRQIGIFFRGPADVNDLLRQMNNKKEADDNSVAQVKVKMLSRKDIGTAHRWWVGQEADIRKNLLSYGRFIYAAHEYPLFIEAAEQNINQTNEMLVKPTRESLIAIPILTVTPHTLHVARLRFMDVFKKLNRIVPVVHYDRYNRQLRLISLKQLFSIELVFTPHKSVFAVAPLMDKKQLDVVWALLFSDLSYVSLSSYRSQFVILQFIFFQFPGEFNAITEFEEYCHQHIPRDEKFIKMMQDIGFSGFYEFYKQYQKDVLLSPVLCYREGINRLEFILIKMGLSQVKHPKYTIQGKSIDWMTVDEFGIKIWDEKQSVCDEKGEPVSSKKLLNLFVAKIEALYLRSPLATLSRAEEKPGAVELFRRNTRWSVYKILPGHVDLAVIGFLDAGLLANRNPEADMQRISELHENWYTKKEVSGCLEFPLYIYFYRDDEFSIYYLGKNTLMTAGLQLLQHIFNMGVPVARNDEKMHRVNSIDIFKKEFKDIINTLLAIRSKIPEAVAWLTFAEKPDVAKTNALCSSLSVSEVLRLQRELTQEKASFSVVSCLAPVELQIIVNILCFLKPEMFPSEYSIVMRGSGVKTSLNSMSEASFMETIWKGNSDIMDSKSHSISFEYLVRSERFRAYNSSKVNYLLFVVEYFKRSGHSQQMIDTMRASLTWAQVEKKKIDEIAAMIDANEQVLEEGKPLDAFEFKMLGGRLKKACVNPVDFELYQYSSVIKTFMMASTLHPPGDLIDGYYVVTTKKNTCINTLVVTIEEFFNKVWREGFESCHYYAPRRVAIVSLNEARHNDPAYSEMFDVLDDFEVANVDEKFRENIPFLKAMHLYRRPYDAIEEMKNHIKTIDSASTRLFGQLPATLIKVVAVISAAEKEDLDLKAPRVFHDLPVEKRAIKFMALVKIHTILFNAIQHHAASKFRSAETQAFYKKIYEKIFVPLQTFGSGPSDAKQAPASGGPGPAAAGPGPRDPAVPPPAAGAGRQGPQRS